jgi:hypothetical protein
MGSLDNLKYEAKLYALENGRWNYYVTGEIRMTQSRSQGFRVGCGSADSEGEALAAAQQKATNDRREREKTAASIKTVALQ